MDSWVIWAVIAMAFAVGEVLTLSFFLGPFAVGALVATAVAALLDATAVELATFLVASALALLVVRPVARRHLRAPAATRTGAAALVGQTATVVAPVDEQAGSVRLNGEVWSARTLEGDAAIDVGRRVHVLEIRGATALVTET
ncbi:MAG: NfeD family protein [Actinomycetota bacterium]|nr:NfeD family protein [Actinomycetota bacterium]